uniref:ARAD1B04774p n=1 Tax=Blastobotrys adeninivorans TaxID=409370 RepID=A0A060TB13_BLAAD
MDDSKSNKRGRIKRQDRPKLKIPLDDTWVLVFCKSGKRFAHNTRTKESLWSPPPEVQKIIDGIDKNDMLKLIARSRGYDPERKRVPRKSQDSGEPMQTDSTDDKNESVIYPESNQRTIEIVDQDEDGNSESEDSSSNVDQASSGSESDVESGAVSFALDSGSDEDDLSPEEKQAKFNEMLNESGVSPYAPWDSLRDQLAEDDRYDVYDTGRERKEVFDAWAKQKIAESKLTAAMDGTNRPESSDPREIYLSFVAKHYKKGLYYVDFKRKYRKEPDFKSVDLSDQQKQSLYRQLSSLLQQPLSDRVLAYKEFMAKNPSNPRVDPKYHALDPDDRI